MTSSTPHHNSDREQAPGAAAVVLVVDDDPAILAMVSRTLESEGYAAVTAGDGEAALAALEAQEPRLVVLDMRMPVRDGPSFAREMRARGYRIPILVMTASNAQQSAREIHAAAYVSKPFDLDEIVEAVDRVLAQSTEGPGDLASP